MHKYLLTLIFVVISILVYGQDENDPAYENVTIYEYEMPLTSCESNFKNLFQNWPKWITNDQQVELLSYQYVTTLEDSASIGHYAKQLNNRKSLGASIKGTEKTKGNGDTTIFTKELYFYVDTWGNNIQKLSDSTNKVAYQSMLENVINKKRKHFKNKVHIGDKVYNIQLKTDQKVYDHYVICRPGENKIVFDNLFLGIKESRDRLEKLF